ncbi:hypothetical protein ACJX0J_011278, partial [Zea mays]
SLGGIKIQSSHLQLRNLFSNSMYYMFLVVNIRDFLKMRMNLHVTQIKGNARSKCNIMQITPSVLNYLHCDYWVNLYINSFVLTQLYKQSIYTNNFGWIEYYHNEKKTLQERLHEFDGRRLEFWNLETRELIMTYAKGIQWNVIVIIRKGAKKTLDAG